MSFTVSQKSVSFTSTRKYSSVSVTFSRYGETIIASYTAKMTEGAANIDARLESNVNR